jgi:hypothetical protein
LVIWILGHWDSFGNWNLFIEIYPPTQKTSGFARG